MKKKIVSGSKHAKHDEVDKLIIDLKTKMVKLIELNIDTKYLYSLTNIENSKRSRLLISKNIEFYLLDCNNAKVEMSPLHKSVYLLFLKYERGIKLCDLPKYNTELLSIYKQITPRVDYKAVVASINDITDYKRNSIHEKLSVIKGAFSKYFSPTIANEYYICGERNKPKKIMLNRKFIINEASIIE